MTQNGSTKLDLVQANSAFQWCFLWKRDVIGLTRTSHWNRPTEAQRAVMSHVERWVETERARESKESKVKWVFDDVYQPRAGWPVAATSQFTCGWCVLTPAVIHWTHAEISQVRIPTMCYRLRQEDNTSCRAVFQSAVRVYQEMQMQRNSWRRNAISIVNDYRRKCAINFICSHHFYPAFDKWYPAFACDSVYLNSSHSLNCIAVEFWSL